MTVTVTTPTEAKAEAQRLFEQGYRVSVGRQGESSTDYLVTSPQEEVVTVCDRWDPCYGTDPPFMKVTSGDALLPFSLSDYATAEVIIEEMRRLTKESDS